MALKSWIYSGQHLTNKGQNLFAIGALSEQINYSSRDHTYHSLNHGQNKDCKMLGRIIFITIALGFIAGCSNTIRGVGQDTANAVDATQSAGQNIDRAASR